MDLDLSPDEADMLSGAAGPGCQLAMRVLTRTARAMGATRLRPISGAHIDSCLYHGQAGVDFAQRLVDGDARVVVPTTLNVSSLDLIHPELYRGDAETGRAARHLMDLYEQLGCEPTWTCAPYQLEQRPKLGEHVAWAESNAIVFANSVLGARTHRYGDFIDIAAAITGRVPDAGLHTDDGRLATVVVDVSQLTPTLLSRDVAYPVLGHVVGARVGTDVAVLTGLPKGTNEDRLKALGASMASSGTVALFHAVGSTPEAPTLDVALGGQEPQRTITVTMADMRAARNVLSTADAASGPPLRGISLGTPHYSVTEFERFVDTLAGRRIAPGFEAYISTGRDVLTELELRGWADALQAAGVQIVTDTCTYITPIIEDRPGPIMTDSAKWAYYAPGNLGVEVLFGSLEDCIESAVAGQLVYDEAVWHG